MSVTAYATLPHAAALPARPIRVMLAEDHAVTLWGLRQLVESAEPRMLVAGVADSCEELLAHVALRATDVVLLDLGLRDASALECVPRLVAGVGVQVVVLTGDLNAQTHCEAVRRGARGVVLKSQPAEHVLQAIERVHRGEVWFTGTLMSMLLGSVPGVVAPPAPAQDEHARRIAGLTGKEREVVAAVVRHRGAKGLVIADALGMSEHTLRNHLTVIYSKLQVQGRLDLYAYALERGLASGGGVTGRNASRPH